MTSDTAKAQSLIQSAVYALKKGDRRAASTYAEQAADLAPQLEQPWLLLAFLAEPEAAQSYLERALQINPSSSRALAGLAWLKQQSIPETPPIRPDLPAIPIPVAPPQSADAPLHKKRRWVWAVLLIMLLGGLAVLVTALRPLENPGKASAMVAQTALSARPTLETTVIPSATWTTTPSRAPSSTNTASPSPTATATSIPTNTSTATAKPTATQPLSPTRPNDTPVATTYHTVAPGDTLMLIAQRYDVSIQNLIAANTIANPSVIYVGQVLTIPLNGVVSVNALPTPVPSGGTNGNGKEIQIDISEQRMYAYQDGKLIFNFVVSTGTGNSTRIGSFKVLDKIPKAYSTRFNIWMPWWLGIYYSGTLENGIHGLPLLMNGVELWGSLLGQPATYGCIESKSSEAKNLYDWAEIGTPVIIRR